MSILIFVFFFCVSFFQNYKEKDAGKVVLYTTSMGILRETYAKCVNMKQILRTNLIKFEERDVFMSSEYQMEIKERMQSDKIIVPQLFVDGHHIGVSILSFSLILFFFIKYGICVGHFVLCIPTS